jgi:hypothetical protein
MDLRGRLSTFFTRVDEGFVEQPELSVCITRAEARAEWRLTPAEP